MYSTKSVADNAVGTLVGASILGAGGALASSLGGASVTDVVLGGVGLFALAQLVFMAKAVRVHRDADRSLRVVGGTEDQRTVLVVDDRVVECDANGYEYFAGRVDDEKLRISRAVAAGKATRFSEFMLRAIVKGDRPTDEDIYEERVHGKGTRFWTRSEIRADEESAKHSPEVWSWYSST